MNTSDIKNPNFRLYPILNRNKETGDEDINFDEAVMELPQRVVGWPVQNSAGKSGARDGYYFGVAFGDKYLSFSFTTKQLLKLLTLADSGDTGCLCDDENCVYDAEEVPVSG